MRAAGGGGIGIGRGGGVGSGYGKGIGSGFGGFIGELRRKGLDVVIVIDGTGSMKLIIDDVKAKMGQLVHAIHRLVPIARVGMVVFGGKGEKMGIQPLTLSSAKVDRLPERHPGERRRRMGRGPGRRVPDRDQQDGLEAIREEGDRAGGRFAAEAKKTSASARADSSVQEPTTEPSTRLMWPRKSTSASSASSG